MSSILIIDDDAAVRRMVARVLSADGYEVHQATDGRDGIKRLQEVSPDLVITDIVMPDQEGFETIREIRRVAASLPIIVISGDTPAVYLRAATELGATQTLSKPFAADALSALVAQLLARKWA
jgi:DNA-binding response OmpR family regulator